MNNNAVKEHALNIGTSDKQISVSTERKKSDSVTAEKRKLDNTLHSNKMKYVKLNKPKVKNPTEKILFANKFDKALFLYSKSK